MADAVSWIRRLLPENKNDPIGQTQAYEVMRVQTAAGFGSHRTQIRLPPILEPIQKVNPRRSAPLLPTGSDAALLHDDAIELAGVGSNDRLQAQECPIASYGCALVDPRRGSERCGGLQLVATSGNARE